ncbi:MAG: TonB family protein, partial [Candidatus Nitrotoga sp.]
VTQRERSVIPLYTASNPITMSLLTLPNEKNEKPANQTKFNERDFPTNKFSPSPKSDTPKTAVQPEVTDLTSNDLPASTETVQPPVAPTSSQEPSAVQEQVAVQEPITAQAPSPVEVVAARFDADYLHNPAPQYPMMSSRLREEGTVYLHVQVHADGYAMHVVVKNSSGYSRLDKAGIDAVKQWRFIPARQGNQAINSWAIVPINFHLKG